jgi:hypothetical protein
MLPAILQAGDLPQDFAEQFVYGVSSDLAGIAAASDGFYINKDFSKYAAVAEDAAGNLEQPIVSPISAFAFVWPAQLLFKLGPSPRTVSALLA